MADRTRPRRLLVTGATGFVGAAVLRELTRRADQGVELRLLARRVPVDSARVDGMAADGTSDRALREAWTAADLTDPASLAGCCEGVDTVLHLASLIGGDPEQCRRTNVDGTEALLAEAGRAGVRRVIQLSTAAVYGDGPHRGCPEGELIPDPVSPTSRTRLAAEQAVLAWGGLVLRPNLIYGRGDRWVVPGVADLLRRVPAWPEGGRARVSMISVDGLAGALVELALGRAEWTGGVLHAVHPQPVTVRELLAGVCRILGLAEPTEELSRDQLAERLVVAGGPVGDRRPALLTSDRWYDGGALWRLLARSPGPGFADRLAGDARWYRSVLRAG